MVTVPPIDAIVQSLIFSWVPRLRLFSVRIIQLLALVDSSDRNTDVETLSSATVDHKSIGKDWYLFLFSLSLSLSLSPSLSAGLPVELSTLGVPQGMKPNSLQIWHLKKHPLLL